MNQIVLEEKVKLNPIMEEVYKRLRTNLEFSGIENKVICITSCNENDGKTTVAYNLAKALAKDQKKTIFIDADMRKSVFHHYNNFDNRTAGLSHYLSGQTEVHEIIYKTNKENLFIIPTGLKPKNPSELLGNQRAMLLIKYLRQNYDYVIIDTPPLGPVTDPLIVASKCDASMLVISSGTTSRRLLKHFIADLENANENFLGVVINKMVTDNHGYLYSKKYGYKYQYSNKYGYRYDYNYGNHERVDGNLSDDSENSHKIRTIIGGTAN